MKKRDDAAIDLSDLRELTPQQLKSARRGAGPGFGKGLALPLTGVRKMFDKLQAEVARSSGMYQADISRIENLESLDDVLVGTLRRYLAAVAGDLELELALVAPDGSRVVLRPAARAALAAPPATARKRVAPPTRRRSAVR